MVQPGLVSWLCDLSVCISYSFPSIVRQNPSLRSVHFVCSVILPSAVVANPTSDPRYRRPCLTDVQSVVLIGQSRTLEVIQDVNIL
jgi:hypothetical protein